MVLYITGEVMNMARNEALEFYGWFSMLILFAGIIGALIGDLGIGNKKAVIYGAILQSIGAFILCIPNSIGLYLGFALFLIGNGLYVPNFNSIYGKQYLDRTRLLDSGFMLLFIAINIGAFLGPITIGYIGELNFNYGFIGVGLLILLSLLPFLSSKPKLEQNLNESKTYVSVNYKLVISALVFLGLFWGIYEVVNFPIIDIQQRIGSELSMKMLTSTRVSSSSFILPFGIIAVIIWTKRYSSQFTKLSIGMIFTLASIGLLYFIPQTLSDVHFVIFIASMVLLGIAEVFIAPVLLSVLTQYSNQKYLAIIMSIAFIPTRLFVALLGIYNEQFFEQPKLALTVAIIGLAIITITLLLLKKNYLQQQINPS
jgi:POT family proton-dependent oligopeptide transporter